MKISRGSISLLASYIVYARSYVISSIDFGERSRLASPLPNRYGYRFHMGLESSQEETQSSRDLYDRQDETTLDLEKYERDLMNFEPGDFVSLGDGIAGVSSNAESIDEDISISVWGGRAILLLVAMIWATNFASVKYLENICFDPPCHHLPSEAALARFGVAAVASLPFLVHQKKDVIVAGLECGAWITLGYFTQAMALSTVSAGKCAFICSLTVVVVPIINAIFFGKEIKQEHIISGALAILGVGVLEGLVDFNGMTMMQPPVNDVSHIISDVTVVNVVSDDGLSISSDSSGWLSSLSASLGVTNGDIIALGQPFGFGISFMRIEHYVEKFKDDKNRIMTIAAAECVAVGLLSLFWVLYDFHGTIPDMSYMLEPHRLGAIAWTGIVTTVLAIYLEGFALQAVSATEAALTFSSEPVWASLFSAWLLHERLNINAYVGGAIILGACVLSALSDLKHEVDSGNH